MYGMKKLTIVWGFVIVIMFGALTAFGFFYKNRTSPYKELEEKLVEAEKKYVSDNFLFPQDKNDLITLKDELVSKNYLDNLNLDGEECDGYVKVSDTGSTFKYKAYIKCSNYTTKDYEK